MNCTVKLFYPKFSLLKKLCVVSQDLKLEMMSRKVSSIQGIVSPPVSLLNTLNRSLLYAFQPSSCLQILFSSIQSYENENSGLMDLYDTSALWKFSHNPSFTHSRQELYLKSI